MTKSARGLFRATGNRPKPVAVRNLLGEYEKVEGGLEREKDEFYPTPAEPTRAFLAVELKRLREFPVIWEPACGNGAMTRELHTVGLQVFQSDMVDRGCGAAIKSFYDFAKDASLPRAVLTNPPFDQCGWGNGQARWLYHALESLDLEYMALLLPWSFPGAAGLAPFWAKHTPSMVYLMRWKIDFTGQGAPPNLNAWYIWDKQRPPPAPAETILRMLDRVDGRQGQFIGLDE